MLLALPLLQASGIIQEPFTTDAANGDLAAAAAESEKGYDSVLIN